MKCDEKRRYETKADAKSDARRLHNHGHPRNRPYKCPDCGYWHTTSATAEQRAFHRGTTRERRAR